MKIVKPLTDNGSQFTDRFTGKAKKPSGYHGFDREWILLGIEHRLLEPRQPQTDGMVERFNGRIRKVLTLTRFRSRESLLIRLERYENLYNDPLRRHALGHRTPLQAIRTWHTVRSELFNGKRKNPAGLAT